MSLPDPPGNDGPPGERPRRGSRFPWFGLVVTLMIIGGLVAVSVPCLLSAVQRSKQKRTMMTLRQLGVAVDAYVKAHDAAPQANSIDELLPTLDPALVRSVSSRDGWGTELRYRLVPGKPRDYVIWSAAKDESFDRPQALPPVNDFTRYFDCDIIWASGGFVQSPEGVQRSQLPPTSACGPLHFPHALARSMAETEAQPLSFLSSEPRSSVVDHLLQPPLLV